MKQLFGFIDETGVLSNDPQQRFFALSILKLENTSELFESVKRLVDTSTWDMQLTLAKKHIKSSVKESEKIAIIADYLSKPNSSNKYFENELQKLKKVFNACMIESDSSVFVQIVDILIGCIVYSYKIENGLSATQTTPKGKLVEYIENKLLAAFQNHNKSSGTFRHKNKLCGGFTIFEPFYFNVYEKK